MRDRGSMTVLVTMVGAAMGLAVLTAITPVLGQVRHHQRAQAAADAAALAGVIDGRSAADSVARANGAALVAWSVRGDEVIVVVAVADQRATARATDAP